MKKFSAGEMYYFRQLDKNRQDGYTALISGFCKHSDGIMLPGAWDRQSLSNVIEAIAWDHPEIFWPDFFKLQYIKMPLDSCMLIPNYFFSEKESEILIKESNTWKKKVCGQIPSSVSTAEKVWMIYDFLSRQITYQGGELSYSNTIIGPMKKNVHASVCEGVAKAFKFLCDEIMVPCILVTGTGAPMSRSSGPHAWNMVRIGNTYRHVDATWEIGNAHRRGIADDKNFLHKDSQMSEYSWDHSKVPECC